MESNAVWIVLSSAFGVALVTALKEIVIWFLNRRAKVKDTRDSAEEIHNSLQNSIDTKYNKVTKRLDRVESKDDNTKKVIDAIAEGTKLLLQEKILSLAIKYIDAGEITHDQRKLIHAMWDVYHHGLNGNGDLDIEMGLIDELPLKNNN